MAVTILFASDRIRKEWNSNLISPILRELITDAATYAATLGWTFFLTCLLRTYAEDAGGSGIHPAGRGGDIRNRDVPLDIQKKVREYVLANWKYNNPNKPNISCWYDADHGSGPHVHAQVHPNTFRVTPTPLRLVV